MDPDPLSTYSLLFSSRFLLAINLISVVQLVIALVAFVLISILSAFSNSLKSIETSELQSIEKERPQAFERLQNLFSMSSSMSTLIAIVNLLLLIIFTITAFFLLVAHLNFIISLNIVSLLLICCFWIIPLALIGTGKKGIHLGIQFGIPVLNLFTRISNILSPQEEKFDGEDVSLEDLKTALPESPGKKKSAANMALYSQVLHFDKLLIKNVMRPKEEIVGLKAIYNFKEVLEKMQRSTFSRMPVYDGNWSNILGIIHCKDLLPYTHMNQHDWNQYIRPILFVKPDDFAQDVLRIFQKSKNHMAIVKDEDGKIVGILTLEDITEEIIGEIDDE